MRPVPVALAAVPELPAQATPESLVESYRRLAEVFHHVLSEQSLDSLLDRIADTLSDLVPYEGLAIYQADEARRLLIPVLARDRWADEILGSASEFGEGLTGWAVQHREPVHTNAAHLDTRRKVVPGTPDDEPEALISVPLLARNQIKGALNIYRLGEDAVFTSEEFELARWFGDAAALALDNAHIRARLEREAQTDSLTGLYNHRYFHERLRAELTRANRTHDAVALLMLDIDDFKRVNDVYGHGAGDSVLCELSELLRATLRGSDVVCRLGGEEFGVIMASCDAEAALGLSARLTEKLSETEFGAAGRITVSMGIAQGPAHAANPRELIACAEAAMMTAKARGKNQIVIFSDDTRERPDGSKSAGRDVRSIAHLKMLQSLAGKLNRLNDVREIGAAIADELRMLIDYHNCRVSAVEGDEVVPIAFRGHLDQKSEHEVEFPRSKVGEGITGHVAVTGESLLLANAMECEFAVLIPGTPLVEESMIAVPLRYGSRVIGTIVISKLGRDQFDEDDVRLIEVLAGHASVALENARLYEAQRREAANLKALLVFTDEMAQAQSLEAIAEDAIATAARLLDAEEAEIWLRRAGAFECAGRLGPGRGRRMDEARASRLLDGRQTPFVIPGRPGSRCPRAIAPLHYGDSLEGWIRVTAPGRSGFGDERLRLLGGIADQAAVALQKARLYADEKESAEIANALLDFGRQLASAEGIDSVLARTVQLAARIVGSPRTSVWLQDSEDADLVARAWHGYAEDEVERVKKLRFDSGRTRDALTVDDPFVTDGDTIAQTAAGATFAVAPIRLDGGRLGCIVAELPAPEEVGEQRMRLLAGIAHQAKLAITNAGSFESLETTFLSTVEALANALEANDEYTSSHARWITDMALRVGEELGLDGTSLKRLELGALFHDIGKIGVPASILSKPGPLTSEERAVIELHPELGERILAPIDRLSDVRAIVRSCHERWDGGGYPDHRSREEIPLEARIILVCDAFHAMTTDRPYRRRLTVAEARRRLRRAAGTQFDPRVVETFLGLSVDGLERHARSAASLRPS